MSLSLAPGMKRLHSSTWWRLFPSVLVLALLLAAACGTPPEAADERPEPTVAVQAVAPQPPLPIVVPTPEFDPETAAAIALGEQYGELTVYWEDLFNRVFEHVADPHMIDSPAVESALQVSMDTYRQALRDLPPTPITEQVARSDGRALDFLVQAHGLVAGSGPEPPPAQRSEAVRIMVEAGNTHMATRVMVADYLLRYGLYSADFGF